MGLWNCIRCNSVKIGRLEEAWIIFHRVSVTSLESIVRKGIMHQPVKVCIKHMYIEQMKMSFGVIYETESCLYLSKPCSSKHLTGSQTFPPPPPLAEALTTDVLSSDFHLSSFCLFHWKLVPYKSFIVVSILKADRTSSICLRRKETGFGEISCSYGTKFLRSTEKNENENCSLWSKVWVLLYS